MIHNIISYTDYKLHYYSSPKGNKTGWQELDRYTNGFFNGELSVVGSCAGIGKTNFLIRLTLMFLRTGKQVLFFSAQENKDVLVDKIDRVERELLETDNHLYNSLNKNNLYIYNDDYLSIEIIADYISQEYWNNKEYLIIIDGIESMLGNVNYSFEQKKLNYTVNSLKKIALSKIIPVIMSANYETESFMYNNNQPTPCNLKGDGVVEEISDKVILLNRPEYFHLTEDCEGNSLGGVMEVDIAKNRNGNIGKFKYKVK